MKRQHKFLLLIFSILVLNNTRNVISFATTTGGGALAWDGESFDIEFKGEGTKENPYIIENVEELAGLSKLVQDGNSFENEYILINGVIDINNQDWMPIGTKENPFLGNIEGTSKASITNLLIQDNHENNGLFGYVGNDLVGAVINYINYSGYININGSLDKDNINVGLLVGYASSTSIISNVSCGFSEIIFDDEYSFLKNYNISSVVGHNSGYIYNSCSYSADISGYIHLMGNNNSSINIGVISGLNEGKIENIDSSVNDALVSVGKIETNNNVTINLGGLVGNNKGILTNSVILILESIYVDYNFRISYTDNQNYQWNFTNIEANVGFVLGANESGTVSYCYYSHDVIPTVSEDIFVPTEGEHSFLYCGNYISGELIKIIHFENSQENGTSTLDDYGYLSNSLELALNLNAWIENQDDSDKYFVWETSEYGYTQMIYVYNCNHSYYLEIDGNILTVSCLYCDEVYEGIIDFDIVQTIYTGKELKPIDVVFEEEINFEIKIIYENNIEPGEAKAIIKVGNASVEYPFTIVRDEDLNPEEAINITQTGINNISNDNVKNDEDLQNALSSIDQTKKNEIVDSSVEKLNEINTQYELGQLEDIEIVDHANKVYQVVRSAIIVENEKEWRTPHFEQKDEDAKVKIANYYSVFINNQYDKLLEYDYDVNLDNYKQSSRMAKKVGQYMENSSYSVHECDGQEKIDKVEQYVSSLSLKMFVDYNEEQADEDFVALVYDAILKHVQQQSLIMLEQIYKQDVESGKYIGPSLDKLTNEYETRKAEIEDIVIFEKIMLETLKEKYIYLINQKHIEGLYSEYEKEQLLSKTVDLETFKSVYKDIFRKWALNEECDITLEELTSVVIEKCTSKSILDKVNKKITSREVIVISVFGGLTILAIILKVIFSKKGWLNE